jgi:hypothetical protein
MIFRNTRRHDRLLITVTLVTSQKSKQSNDSTKNNVDTPIIVYQQGSNIEERKKYGTPRAFTTTVPRRKLL